jgi:RimJ/RimL family protein N-acetyltransferase
MIGGVLTTLPDGRRILIRPIRESDKACLRWGLAHLSPQSVYARFLSPKPRFSERELEYLTAVDGVDHVALVAAPADEPSQLLGVARFVRDREDRTRAEAAVTIADAMQGQGLGTALGLALADEARVRGIRHFTATMLPTNVAALKLFEHLTLRLRSEIHDGVRELVADLAA